MFTLPFPMTDRAGSNRDLPDTDACFLSQLHGSRFDFNNRQADVKMAAIPFTGADIVRVFAKAS
jgi:hypothetical protein